MEEDIQNYSPTVMFRGTPCINKEIIWKCRTKDILKVMTQDFLGWLTLKFSIVSDLLSKVFKMEKNDFTKWLFSALYEFFFIKSLINHVQLVYLSAVACLCTWKGRIVQLDRRRPLLEPAGQGQPVCGVRRTIWN